MTTNKFGGYEPKTNDPANRRAFFESRRWQHERYTDAEAVAAVGDAYVNIDGDTMTGPLIIEDASGRAGVLQLRSPSDGRPRIEVWNDEMDTPTLRGFFGYPGSLGRVVLSGTSGLLIQSGTGSIELRNDTGLVGQPGTGQFYEFSGSGPHGVKFSASYEGTRRGQMVYRSGPDEFTIENADESVRLAVPLEGQKTPLRVDTGTEITGSEEGSGYMQFGAAGSRNLAFDTNNIQVRNGSGVPNTLGIQVGGGDVNIGASEVADRGLMRVRGADIALQSTNVPRASWDGEAVGVTPGMSIYQNQPTANQEFTFAGNSPAGLNVALSPMREGGIIQVTLCLELVVGSATSFGTGFAGMTWNVPGPLPLEADAETADQLRFKPGVYTNGERISLEKTWIAEATRNIPVSNVFITLRKDTNAGDLKAVGAAGDNGHSRIRVIVWG